jgi:biofilm PGA synthesis N-glycosyltransferase PgaC
LSVVHFFKPLAAFFFGYPFVMAYFWMFGGILFRMMYDNHERFFRRPPILSSYPPVSVLVPCYNEEMQAEETFAVLAAMRYPNYEIIAINDGSTDGTASVLERLAERIPIMRVVHLASNQGKSTALNCGAMVAKNEILVCIDGDALLDSRAITWFVRWFQVNPHTGALTGNPRIRNRTTLLGQLQVGEFSSIIGLIKRTNTVYGRLFTVSGVVCAFRKRALNDAGWWSPGAITEDVDVSWRIQLAHWGVSFEPKAICWTLMPETLKGLWSQRLRWSEGGTRVVLDHFRECFHRGAFRMIPMGINYIVSILWSYVALFMGILWLLEIVGIGDHWGLPRFTMISSQWGMALALTYFLQASISVLLDSRYEEKMAKSLFYVVWYPLVFWLLQATTAATGLPRAFMRARHVRGRWTSPDRGIG